LDLTHHLPKQQHLNLQLLLASTAGREKKLEHTPQSLSLLLATTAAREGRSQAAALQHQEAYTAYSDGVRPSYQLKLPPEKRRDGEAVP
jgi:hypothetical protein